MCEREKVKIKQNDSVNGPTIDIIVSSESYKIDPQWGLLLISTKLLLTPTSQGQITNYPSPSHPTLPQLFYLHFPLFFSFIHSSFLFPFVSFFTLFALMLSGIFFPFSWSNRITILLWNFAQRNHSSVILGIVDAQRNPNFVVHFFTNNYISCIIM